jgi:hypothetical protein
VLYVDEAGGMSWHRPDAVSGGFRSTQRARFTIATRAIAAAVALDRQRKGGVPRGPLTKLGRKLFKVLVVPIASAVLGDPVASIVGAIERKHRQNLVRSLTPDNYRLRVTDPFADWSALSRGRSLLVVHGIFSSTEGMLAGLPKDAMRELVRSYHGRVIAFDHLTLAQDPEQNARFFLQQLRRGHSGTPIEFDILSHSRGGIVSRVLAERGAMLEPDAPCSFRKVCFVATPNVGSALADPEHMVDMIDVFTNLATNFPDGPVTYSIEVILALVKLLVSTAERHVPGLAAMGTTSFIRALNSSGTPSSAEYACVASDYEPSPARDNGFFTGPFADGIIDRVFGGNANDLVVPRDGVFAANGHASFPIMRRLVFDASDHVWHSGYFAERRALTHIMNFLAPVQEATASDAEARERGPVTFPAWPSAAKRVRRGAKKSGARPTTKRGSRGTREARTRQRSSKRSGVRVQRVPHIDFHELVRAGEKNKLTVRLSDIVAPEDRAKAFGVALGRGAAFVTLRVSLSAPGFDVEPGPDRSMKVGRKYDRKKEQVAYQLTAREPGRSIVTKEITADIWLGNSCLGAVTHYTNVAPTGYKGKLHGDGRSKSEPFVLREEARRDCDLVVEVFGKNKRGRPPFQIRLTSTDPKAGYRSLDVGELDFSTKNVAKHMQGIVDKFARGYRSDFTPAEAKAWRTSVTRALDDLGKDLWRRLPEGFRNEYFRLIDHGKSPESIQIHSDEMIIPWELVIPYRAEGTLEPLGVRHVMGRWRPGVVIKPAHQRMRIEHAVIVNPQYTGEPNPLWWSLIEATELEKLTNRFQRIRPADLDAVEDVLNRDDVQLFHFTGHGTFDKRDADLSTLELEATEKLPATSFLATKLLTKGQPIMYLNACDAGSTGIVLGQMGGFTATCLQEGCSGIIAPYWPISDKSAKQFALAFYGRLQTGEAIGTALKELRARHAGDPTYQAFAYFGDPWTRPQIGAAVATGKHSN